MHKAYGHTVQSTVELKVNTKTKSYKATKKAISGFLSSMNVKTGIQ